MFIMLHSCQIDVSMYSLEKKNNKKCSLLLYYFDLMRMQQINSQILTMK